jgi:peptide/nickel transport system permease protein
VSPSRASGSVGWATRPTWVLNSGSSLFNYILRRLLIAVPSLLGISVILFTVLALAPGDPFEDLAMNPNVPPEVRMALRAKFGLDDPVWQRYLAWLSNMLRGDWGFSFVSRIDVDTLILQRLPVTIIVIGLSQFLALCVALPVGILAAVRPYSWFDRIASTIAFVGFSLPTFFTGVLFILFFSIYLGWFPFVFRADINETGWRFLWEHFRQSIMPITVLGLFQAASMMRYVRSSVLDVIRLDYVTTARSKGLAERVVINKHVVRNALIPVVTLVALQMPAVFGGAIVTEQIFRIPGIGSLLIDAILRNDTPVIMAVTFVFAALVIFFNLVADVLYGWLDPRISYR